MRASKQSRGNTMFRTPGVFSVGRSSRVFLVVIIVAGLAGCDTGPAESLWNPDDPVGEPPVITAVDPPDIALAGVDLVTISGSNFAADPARVIVFFGGTRVPVLEASESQLTVRAPNEPSPEVNVRVAVVGNDAESFSNGWQLALLPAEEEFGGILDSEAPFAIAADPDGNIYASIFRGGVSVGIRRIAVDGTESAFSATTFQWKGLDFGPGGLLYGARGVRAIFQFPDGGGIQQTWAVEGNSSVVFVDIDFDTIGNVWAVGDNENLYRIAPDKAITPFPFTGDVRAVKVVGASLFVAVAGEGGGEIWRFAIAGNGDIDAGTLYFDLAAETSAEVLSLEAATNGDLFVGTDDADPIWVVHPDGTGEPLYPGVLSAPAASLAWTVDPFLVVSEARSSSVTIPKLRKVNTRLEGVR